MINTEPIINITIPVKIISTSNLWEHWTKKKKRNDNYKLLMKSYWNSLPSQLIKLPCIIKLIRIAPRNLDYDNLVHSFKYIRDSLADLIKPGYAPGQADKTELLFEYEQTIGKPKQYAFKIKIYDSSS